MKYHYFVLSFLVLFLTSCSNKNKEKIISQKLMKDTISLNKTKKQEVKESRILDCEECSIECLVQIESRLGKLKKDEILMFFKANTKKCAFNVEFSEFANELVFEVFNSDFNVVLIALKEVPQDQFEWICNTLNNPVSDKYTTIEIIEKLKRVEIETNETIRTLLDCLIE